MKFKWKKKRKVVYSNSNLEWMNSHAQVPFTLEFEDKLRVYFSTREKDRFK